jgi:head-tail adaptor
MIGRKDITSKKIRQNIGSMRHRIDIQKRKDSFRATSQQFSFETVYTRWADIDTYNGLKKFSGINIEDTPTHIFKIRTIDALTSEFWILFDSTRFKIIKIEKANIGGHQIIYCKETGSSSLNGSDA